MAILPVFLTQAALCCALLLICSPSTLLAQDTPAGSTTTVTVAAAPAQVHISGNTELCKGGETILKAEGDYESFQWNTGGDTRYLRVREEGTYEVTAKTKAGCTFTSAVTVRFRPCPL